MESYTFTCTLHTKEPLSADAIKRILYHTEELIDMDSWPEIDHVSYVQLQHDDE